MIYTQWITYTRGIQTVLNGGQIRSCEITGGRRAASHVMRYKNKNHIQYHCSPRVLFTIWKHLFCLCYSYFVRIYKLYDTAIKGLRKKWELNLLDIVWRATYSIFWETSRGPLKIGQTAASGPRAGVWTWLTCAIISQSGSIWTVQANLT